MATKHPRLNVVLEPVLMKGVEHLAKSQGLSLSTVARDLIKEALETYEDSCWDKKAAQRLKNYSRSKSLAHQQVWG